MKKLLLIGLCATAALGLSACSTEAPTIPGIWGNQDDSTAPSLDLSDDGRATGTDGCNRLMGGYTVNGDTITFEQMASTMMFCEGVETWLGNAHTATVSGNTMTVLSEDGKEIGKLERAKE